MCSQVFWDFRGVEEEKEGEEWEGKEKQKDKTGAGK